MGIRLHAFYGMPRAALPLCALLIGGLPGGASAQQSAVPMTSWDRVLDQSPQWYASADAVRIADNVLLYQLDNGGWDKNINMAAVLGTEGRADVLARRAEMLATIDNGATMTQMGLLTRVYQGTGVERFREGFSRGLDYVLEAQYENGGWPQYYPLRDGYYSRITFNDHAMVNVMNVLREIVGEAPQYAFVPAAQRARAAVALEKAVDVILMTQIRVDGVQTAWCAQHDEHDLSPAQARSYELPSLSGRESVGLIRYLMSIENPSPEVIEAVQSAVAWLDEVAVHGIRVDEIQDPAQPSGRDRIIVEDPDAPRMWARFYEIGRTARCSAAATASRNTAWPRSKTSGGSAIAGGAPGAPLCWRRTIRPGSTAGHPSTTCSRRISPTHCAAFFDWEAACRGRRRPDRGAAGRVNWVWPGGLCLRRRAGDGGAITAGVG